MNRNKLVIPLFLAGCGLASQVGEAPAEKVTFRDDHVVLLDGKPFFPLGLYYAREAFEDPSGKLFEETKSYGFNTVNYFNGYKTVPAELDLAHRHGFVIWTRGYNGLAIDSDASAALLAEQVRATKDHPALLFWEVEDEPLLNKVDLEQVKRGQALVRQLDPHHPVLVVEWPKAVDRLGLWKEVGDIYGTDLYPIPRSRAYGGLPNKDITQMRDYLAAIRQERGDRPMMLVLQAWNWEPLNYGKSGYPTVAESRFMAYQGVIHGAKALFYYGQLHCSRPNSASALYSAATDPATQQAEFQKCLALNREFWQGHKSFFQELAQAADIFVLRDAAPEKRASLVDSAGKEAPVEMLTKQGTQRYILAVNASPTATSATFQIPQAMNEKEIHVRFENRSLKVEGGRFSDSFEPYGVHVYAESQK